MTFHDLSPRILPTGAARTPHRTVDVHTHLSVPSAAEVARPFARPELEPRAQYSSPETLAYTAALRATPLQTARFEAAEQRLVDMDAQGIDVQVIAAPPTEYFYWLPAAEALRACRLQHERFAEVVAAHPDRFVALAALPLGHPDLAVEMLHEARDLGMRGFEISTEVMGADARVTELDHPSLDPVWAAAVELGMTAVMHPQGFTHGERFTDYYLVNVLCMPLASTLAMTRMILGGVWQRHPDLSMLVVHGGGYLPFYAARTDHAFRHRPELRVHIDREPSEYLRLLHFDTNVFEPAMVRHLVKEYGPDHVLLGTDYPFDMGTADPLAFLNAAGLANEEARLVMGGNAERLFGIA
jgi:aminocarboxymuconate-semialdehyde decarboxylase